MTAENDSDISRSEADTPNAPHGSGAAFGVTNPTALQREAGLAEHTRTVRDPFIHRFPPARYAAVAQRLYDDPDFFRKLKSIRRDIESGAIQRPVDRHVFSFYLTIMALAGLTPVIDTGRGGMTYAAIRDGYLNAAAVLEPTIHFFREAGTALGAKIIHATDPHTADIRRRLADMLAEHIDLIHPKAVWYIVYGEPNANGFTFSTADDTFHFAHPDMARFFHAPLLADPDAEYENFSDDAGTAHRSETRRAFVFYCVTIGPDIDRLAANLSAAGDMSTALFINAIGAGAAEMVAEDINAFFNERMTPDTALDDPTPKPRFRRLAPGYGGWPLTDQRVLDRLLDFRSIGVTLNDGDTMQPEKSTSGVMGWKYPSPK